MLFAARQLLGYRSMKHRIAREMKVAMLVNTGIVPM
jgi:hypothetical protein